MESDYSAWLVPEVDTGQWGVNELISSGGMRAQITQSCFDFGHEMGVVKVKQLIDTGIKWGRDVLMDLA